MKPIPCKQCISFAMCFNRTEIHCSIICKWIRVHAFTDDTTPFNKEGYDLAMDEVQKIFGRVFSSRTDQNRIWDTWAYEKEVIYHAMKRQRRRSSATNAV